MLPKIALARPPSLPGGGVTGQGYLGATSGADGRFTVRILPESYTSMQLYPNGGADAGYAP